MEKPIILLHSSGKGIYRVWRGESIGTTFGELSREGIARRGLVKSNTGEEFLVLDASVRDRVQNQRRGARPVYEYDAGFAAGLLALGKDKKVLEAGTGSASVTQVFAGMCESVDTFEKEERFYEIAKENIALSGLDNITINLGDIREQELPEEKYDAVFLDLKEPAEAVQHVWNAMKKGAYICVFTPIADDVTKTREALTELKAMELMSLKLKNKLVNKDAEERADLSYPAYYIVARKFK